MKKLKPKHFVERVNGLFQKRQWISNKRDRSFKKTLFCSSTSSRPGTFLVIPINSKFHKASSYYSFVQWTIPGYHFNQNCPSPSVTCSNPQSDGIDLPLVPHRNRCYHISNSSLKLQFGEEANLCCTWKVYRSTWNTCPANDGAGRMKRYDSKHHRGKVIQIEIFTNFPAGTETGRGVEQTALETRNLICIHSRFVYFFCQFLGVGCGRWVSFDSNDEKQFWSDLFGNFEREYKMGICLIFSNWGNLWQKSSKFVIRHNLWILPNLSTGWNDSPYLRSTASSVY